MFGIISWIRDKYFSWKKEKSGKHTDTEIICLLEKIGETLELRGYLLSSRYQIKKINSILNQDVYVVSYYLRKRLSIFPILPENGVFDQKHILRFTITTKPDRAQLCVELRNLLKWTKQLPDMNSNEFWLQIRRKMREEEPMRVLC